MSTLNLTSFKSDGLEFYVDETTGKAYASIRATARMLNVHASTIQRRVQAMSEGVARIEVVQAEILTQGGLQAAVLLDSEQVFKLALDYNSELAFKMGSAGANLYVCGLAGYQTKVELPAQPVPALPPHVVSVQIADSIRHITDTLDDNPRLAQVLIDNAIAPLVAQKQLPGQPQLRGVAEIATEMGFKIDLSNRTKLGKFIARAGFPRTKESRLCNGVMAEINCYRDTPELRDAIASFFS